MQTHTRNYKSYSYAHDIGAEAGINNNHPARKRMLVIAFLIMLSLGAKGLISIVPSGNAKKPVAFVAAQEKKKPEPPKKVVDTSNLQTSIEQITRKYPYNTSVAVVELNTDKLIQTGDTYPYLAASTTKLLTASYYFHQVEIGQASLSQTIAGKPAREQLMLMINKSDNDAWAALNSYLGKPNMEQFAHDQGLASYKAEDNVMTSRDMAVLVAKIYKREMTNDEHTKMLLSWMQNTSEERFIPPGIPAGTTFYHKAGYLPDRIHDVAIVDNGSTPFALVIYSKSYTDSYDYELGQKLYKQLTTQIVSTFNQP